MNGVRPWPTAWNYDVKTRPSAQIKRVGIGGALEIKYSTPRSIIFGVVVVMDYNKW